MTWINLGPGYYGPAPDDWPESVAGPRPLDDRVAGGRDDPGELDQPTPHGWDGGVWDEYAATTRHAGGVPDPAYPHDQLGYGPGHADPPKQCGCLDNGWPCQHDAYVDRGGLDRDGDG